MYLVSASQMNRMDKATIENFGIPGSVLMENAGRGATRVLMEQFGDLTDKKIGIIAGKGNNGGDAFVIARYLTSKGISATVYLLGVVKSVKGDAALNLNLLNPLNVPLIEITCEKDLIHQKSSMAKCDIWVDGIFGTGLNSEVKGFFKSVIQFINSLNKPVMAIDIPSGLDPDTGQPLGLCINADHTATFGFAKTGHMQFPGSSFSGDIHIIDIGIPGHITSEAFLSAHLLTPLKISKSYIKRSDDAHKGTTGHLLIIGASKGKTGAAVMASRAAMRTGAGLVTNGIPESLADAVDSLHTEAMTLPLPQTNKAGISESASELIGQAIKGKSCIAAGPGLGTEAQTASIVKMIIEESEVPVVLDADALNLIALKPAVLLNRKAPVILTPHPGEMSRLTGESTKNIQKNRIRTASEFARAYNVILILKGTGTLIAHPDGKVFINPTGSPAMASGGMGDVLTGIIAGFITQGYPPENAAHAGAYLHGLAGEILAEKMGPAGILASDIINMIPSLINKMAIFSLPPLKRIRHLF